MKLHEQYIDRIINDTINESLDEFNLKQSFRNGLSNLKQRTKNGLSGYDTGRNYQKFVDNYSDDEGNMDLNPIIEELKKCGEYLAYYIKYFSDYEGNNMYMTNIKTALENEYQEIQRVYNTFSEEQSNEELYQQTLHSSMTNEAFDRLRGFGHGFMQNRDYKDKNAQNISKTGSNSELEPQMVSLLDANDKLINAIEKFEEAYKDYFANGQLKQYQPIFDHIMQTCEYIEYYVSEEISIERSKKDSILTKGAYGTYNLGRKGANAVKRGAQATKNSFAGPEGRGYRAIENIGKGMQNIAKRAQDTFNVGNEGDDVNGMLDSKPQGSFRRGLKNAWNNKIKPKLKDIRDKMLYDDE